MEGKEGNYYLLTFCCVLLWCSCLVLAIPGSHLKIGLCMWTYAHALTQSFPIAIATGCLLSPRHWARCLDVYYILRGLRLIYTCIPMNCFQWLIFSPRVNLFFTLSSVKCNTCSSWICALNSWMTRWCLAGTAMLASLDVFPPLLDSSALSLAPKMLILQTSVHWFTDRDTGCSLPLFLVPLLFPSFLPLSLCVLISVPVSRAVQFPITQIMS